MTVGMRGRGFFAGAVGGLALALLLVGVASFLPHSNGPLQAGSLTQGSESFGGAPWAATSTSKAMSTSTTTAGGAQIQSGAQNESAGAPSNSNTTATTTVAAATTTTAASRLTAAPDAVSSATSNGSPSGPSASGGAKQRPSSLLAVLPGESVASLLATLSPLILGLLVAMVVYGAYTRRQNSSS